MSVTYSNTIGLPWIEYLKVNAQLQTQDTIKDVAYSVDSSSRKQIATMQQISDAQLLSVHENTEAVREGTEIIGLKLDAIDQSLGKIQATFEWAVAEITMELGRLNDSIQELISIAKTPSQTWAYEQYEIARDNVRRGLYEEAIEPLNRAINGYGDNTGYAVDYRFHYLHGVIRLGNYHNYSEKIVNPRLAYEAFKKAGKYAEHDDPDEAALAYLSAGWAAYVLDDMETARLETRKAIELNGVQAESYFQLAKIEASDKDIQSATDPLHQAIAYDVNYSIKASADESFKPYIEEVNQAIEDVKNDMSTRADRAIELMNDHYESMIKPRNEIVEILGSAGYDELKNSVYRSGIVELKRLLHQAKEERKANTLFGMKNVITILGDFYEKALELKRDLIPTEDEISSSAENKKRNDDLNKDLGEFFAGLGAIGMSSLWVLAQDDGIIELVFFGLIASGLGVSIFRLIDFVHGEVVSAHNRKQDQIFDRTINKLGAVEFPVFGKLDESWVGNYFGYSEMTEEKKYELGMLILRAEGVQNSVSG